jgi:hypothetical protein
MPSSSTHEISGRPVRSSSMVAPASPRRMAAARSAMAPPQRWTRRRTTIPSLIGDVDVGACSPAAGPTMSPRTAPASTEASWSGSPTRIRRASAPTASTRLAIIEVDTIDVSSTITTS